MNTQPNSNLNQMIPRISTIIALLLPLVLATNSWAQEYVPIDKKDFKDEQGAYIKHGKEAFKEAWKSVRNGDLLFQQVEWTELKTDELVKVSLKNALSFYLESYKYNPNIPALNYRIGVCYLMTIEKDQSIEYLEKAYKQNEFIATDILYFLAQSHHLTYDFENAILYYQGYLKKLSPDDATTKKALVEKRIKECQAGIELKKDKKRVFIDNMGSRINSSNGDHSPLISADESAMVFTSKRKNSSGDSDPNAIDGYNEDIYITIKKNKTFSIPTSLGEPINTKEHDATVSFSPDGQQLFIVRRGEIMVTELDGDTWTKPQSLSKNINSKKGTVSDVSVSPDGKTLYFSTTDPDDNQGGFDIFMSRKDFKGKWGKGVNLGATINTPYNERGVFMHPDGRTLYFSSEGHNNMGGFDLFFSTLNEDGTWSKPTNLGYPINTPGDDIFLTISGNGRRGYYSSEKTNGLGGTDIYVITFLGPEKPALLGNEDILLATIKDPVAEVAAAPAMEMQRNLLTILKGTVKDKKTLEPISADIDLVDNGTQEVIATFRSNKKTGKFLVSLPSGRNYGIAVKAEDYLFHSENFDIPKTASFQEVEKHILLQKIEIGHKIILKNVFFDFDKATLRETSRAELDRLVKLMNDHAKIKVEISGHTDSKGSDDYNKSLSKNRAKSVVEYLIAKGIAKDRLTYAGFGEEQPIATNDTEEGRQENRRVEFKIVSKD